MAEGSDYCTTGTYISGGNMAAPLWAKSCPTSWTIWGWSGVSELRGVGYHGPQLVGGTVSNAEVALKLKKLTYRTVGEGDTITGQIPASGATIPSGSEVIIYLGAEKPADPVKVPS